MTERRKPKLLIIGHARHGKDTLAELIRDKMGLAFTSSSIFVGEECIWPVWGQERYPDFDTMFADRVNYRKTWADLISAYNTPDKTRTAKTMLDRGYDMYVGMRKMDEFMACHEAKLFDHVIWVDALKRLPPEGKDSNEMIPSLADLYCDNNEGIENLHLFVELLQKKLHDDGFEVGYQPPVEVPGTEYFEPEEQPALEWEDMPEGAIKVLDHGFFIVREVMGSDKAIADSARMSYGRGTKKVNPDAGLINYLVQNYHTSPLEMGEIRVHMRLPIFVMRQLVRHRTANLNEYSGRYSEMVRLFYVPELAQICSQDKVNKQGSAEPLDEQDAVNIQNQIFEQSNAAFDAYELLLAQGVSRETARIVLPLNTYTEVVWKMDVSNLIKFLKLRDDSHAQYEIRVYAKLLAEALGHFFPDVYAAYERDRARVSLNQDQIKALITGDLENLPKGELKVVQDLLNLHWVQGRDDL
jgi:thymidylate synthase (FAD)